MKNRNSFMETKRDFWFGFGSILSISDDNLILENIMTDNDVDYNSIKSDWEKIGQDFKWSINNTLR